MYRYRPPARVVYAAIVANGSSICIFKNPPTDAQGDKMAAALDPANVIIPRDLLATLTADEHPGEIITARRQIAIGQAWELLK